MTKRAPSSGAFLPASLMYFCSGKPMHFCSGVDSCRGGYESGRVLLRSAIGKETETDEARYQHRPGRWQRGGGYMAARRRTQPARPAKPVLAADAELLEVGFSGSIPTPKLNRPWRLSLRKLRLAPPTPRPRPFACATPTFLISRQSDRNRAFRRDSNLL